MLRKERKVVHRGTWVGGQQVLPVALARGCEQQQAMEIIQISLQGIV